MNYLFMCWTQNGARNFAWRNNGKCGQFIRLERMRYTLDLRGEVHIKLN